MELTSATRLEDLLKEYPFLVDFLAEYKPQFRKLRNPLMRKVVARTAKLETVASMGGVAVDQLISDLLKAIESGQKETPERLERRAALKSILRGLHEGQDPEALKERFANLIGDVSPGEIGKLEQQLVGEGLGPEEITKLCDLHVRIFQEGLEKQAKLETGTEHPLTLLRNENNQIGKSVIEFRNELNTLKISQSDATRAAAREKLRERLDALAIVDAHYQRKENQLFPFLEKRGITAPPQVMWSVHDEIRSLLKDIRTALASADDEQIFAKGSELAQKIDDMIYKEEKILFPMAVEVLAKEDWEEMLRSEARREPLKSTGGLIQLDTGALSLEQLNLMLTHLPIDATFVDKDDVVRYYSEGKERIFVRTPEVIGRKVQNCHPPKSVHIVNKILEEFKAGRRDVAEFWIELDGKFVHIRYYAVRDKQQHYLGTIEVTQDVTSIRELQGERRLLDWR